MPIELKHDQTAEPGKCGSCQHFDRRDGEYETHGVCTFVLPPWVPMREVDMESHPRTVRDTEGCMLYRRKGGVDDATQFMKMRYWNAGDPS